MNFNNYVVWTFFVLVFSVIEIVIPSLVSIWFAIAAGLTIPIALIFENLYVEFPFFVLISIFLIVFTRPYAKKFLNRNKENFDSSMIGKSITVLKFNFFQNSTFFYDVKFKGSVWTGISSEKFSKDDTATIVGFEGNKIMIKK